MKLLNTILPTKQLTKRVKLALGIAIFAGSGWLQVHAAESLAILQDESAQERPPALIDPNVERREITESDIDTENFELGVFGGFISIEDFESDAVLGVTLAYHVNENFFLEAAYGQTTAGETSFEKLSGGAPFLTDEERDYRYYNLSLGFNINGETFLTDNLVFNSDFYILVGAGSTEFGGDERFTMSVGAGYRLLLTDFWALRVDVKDHVFNSDIIGVEKDVHNLAFSLSTTFFF